MADSFAASSTHKTGFLDLPKELRDEIFELAMPEHRDYVIQPRRHARGWLSQSTVLKKFRLTSRGVRNAAKSIFFGKCTFTTPLLPDSYRQPVTACEYHNRLCNYALSRARKLRIRLWTFLPFQACVNLRMEDKSGGRKGYKMVESRFVPIAKHLAREERCASLRDAVLLVLEKICDRCEQQSGGWLSLSDLEEVKTAFRDCWAAVGPE